MLPAIALLIIEEHVGPDKNVRVTREMIVERLERAQELLT